MGIININDKEYSVFDDSNYVTDFDDHKQWCKHCVYFGHFKNDVYNLCCNNYLEISVVSFCGHCDKFSDTKKINPIKRWLLANVDGFVFKNKVR